MSDPESRAEIDGISLGIVHGRLMSAVDAAAVTLVRTAYSHIIRDAKDFAVGLLDADCSILSQSTQSIPVFLGGMARTASEMVAYVDALAPGDILVTNDPWIGSGHLPDVNMLIPVFDGVELIGYVLVIAHMADIGGRLLGTEAFDLYEEGFQIPVMHVARDGHVVEVVLELIRRNVRVPDQVMGDLEAMVAAGHVAAAGLRALARDPDVPDLRNVARELSRRGEVAMRQAIRQLKPGTYRAAQLVERGGDLDPVEIKVEITVDTEAGSIAVDWSGTSPQGRTSHNATAGYTRAYTGYALKCLLAPAAPFTGGIFAPLEVVVPEGSALGSRRPAAVGARHVVGQSTTSIVLDALAESMPEAVIAQCGSPRPFITLAGSEASGRPFTLPILAMGGFGGRARSDGPSALPFPTNTEAVPVEVLEAASPLQVVEKELAVDSGGAGAHRGGLGQRVRVRALTPAVRVSAIASRTLYPACGIFGGADGSPTRISIVTPAGHRREVTGEDRLEEGDELVIESPGGGGYGAPSKRDSERLALDVVDGYVSADAARALYGAA
jgi:N-methylhydantoinase B